MRKNNELYEKLLAETAKASEVPAETIIKDRDSRKRWSCLSEFWREHKELFKNPFYPVLYHIAWGTPAPVESGLEGLIDLLETTFALVPEAVREWRQGHSYNHAYFRVLKNMPEVDWCLDSAVRDAASYRLLVRTHDESERETLSHIKDAWRKYRSFVDVLKMLLPAAESWEDSHFLNEGQIFKELKHIYSYDFRGARADFNHLMRLLMCKGSGMPYFEYLFQISHLPGPIVRLVWPDGMKKEFGEQLLLLSKQESIRDTEKTGAPAWDSPERIVRGWAFKKLCQWRSELPDSVRSAMMLYLVGIHPRSVGKGLIGMGR